MAVIGSGGRTPIDREAEKQLTFATALALRSHVCCVPITVHAGTVTHTLLVMADASQTNQSISEVKGHKKNNKNKKPSTVWISTPMLVRGVEMTVEAPRQSHGESQKQDIISRPW